MRPEREDGTEYPTPQHIHFRKMVVITRSRAQRLLKLETTRQVLHLVALMWEEWFLQAADLQDWVAELAFVLDDSPFSAAAFTGIPLLGHPEVRHHDLHDQELQ